MTNASTIDVSKLSEAQRESLAKQLGLQIPRKFSMYVRANPDPAKRTISLYDSGPRNPITRYAGQWLRILGVSDPKQQKGFPEGSGALLVLQFIDEHRDYLPFDKATVPADVPATLIGEGLPFRVPKGSR